MEQSKRKRPRLLIVSFSDFSVDARVLRQVKAFATDYEVTTCGRGPKPHPDVHEHIQMTSSHPRWNRLLQGTLLNLRLHRLVYWLTPQHREARKKLKGRRFDFVIANDIPAAGVIQGLTPPKAALLDLHEYWPGVNDDRPDWNRVRRPHFVWQLRTFGRRAGRFTTVNAALARLYKQKFGFDCGVVTNASELREDLRVGTTARPLRFVHSGAARPMRRIEVMMRAVDSSESLATLDLYLMGNTSQYYQELKALEAELSDRVRILPPVEHESLVEVLNRYDVGLPFLPPTTTNIRYCLPNKFFDYVQARLAILTGPTPPMVELLEEYDLGVVTDDFEVDSLARAIDALELEEVSAFKANADAAAGPLSAPHQNLIWREIVDGELSRSTKPQSPSVLGNG